MICSLCLVVDLFSSFVVLVYKQAPAGYGVVAGALCQCLYRERSKMPTGPLGFILFSISPTGSFPLALLNSLITSLPFFLCVFCVFFFFLFFLDLLLISPDFLDFFVCGFI